MKIPIIDYIDFLWAVVIFLIKNVPISDDVD